MIKTQEDEAWSGEFGKAYTDRNLMSLDELDQLYVDNYGISRTEINKEFLAGLDVDRILEVGCNVGNQLLLLKWMGYANPWGIELHNHAVELARKRTSGINIVKGSAFDIPCKDGFFDLVFTSGVLMHISPDEIEKALDEIHRCTNMYIWGFEYYSPDGYPVVDYRGDDNLLWKTDFAKLFMDRFPDMELVKEHKYY
jgi:pseudaminic acid biosynthesis-associated methylase